MLTSNYEDGSSEHVYAISDVEDSKTTFSKKSTEVVQELVGQFISFYFSISLSKTFRNLLWET